MIFVDYFTIFVQIRCEIMMSGHDIFPITQLDQIDKKKPHSLIHEFAQLYPSFLRFWQIDLITTKSQVQLTKSIKLF